MAPNIKLFYWEMPGRAETTRIMLAHGGIQFEDVLIDKTSWPSIKPNMPFGQVPVLEVDGKMLAQSSAIEQYVAKLAGLMPTDPWEAAKVDEIAAFMQDVSFDTIRPTFAIADLAERIKARQELCAGAIKAKLEQLTVLLQSNGGNVFVGNSVTYADIAVYSSLSLLVSGFLDGVPRNLLDDHPVLKVHHNKIAALPAMTARYEHVTEGLRVSLKAL